MVLKFFGDSINEQHVTKIIGALNNDGIIIIPTDTVYAFAGNLHSKKAMEQICRIRNIKPEKANFSLLCHDLGNISHFTRPFSNETFRLMKSKLPGPFTFILNANSNVPALFKSNKKTIGIRVPDNPVALAIIKKLGNPLVVTSVRSEGAIEEYMADPAEIQARFGDAISFVIDAGPGELIPSTVIDCTADTPVVIREGKGNVID